MINGLEYQNQVEDVLSDCIEEINQYRLSTQLQILKPKFVDSNEKTVSAVIIWNTTLVYKQIATEK